MENGVTEKEEEPNFSDPEDFVDDITDEDLLGDVLREKPQESETEHCCVIVDGIPVVDVNEKLPKLKNVLGKLLSKFGTVRGDHYPADEDGKTKGYVFIEYANRTSAEEAAATLNGYRLDKNHLFSANLFSDLAEYRLEPDDENWTPPQPRTYKNHGNLWWWLLDPRCLDQYAVQWKSGIKVSVYWNSSTREQQPILASSTAERENWTETIVKWSPCGTYLATFHGKGIALWGGEKFERVSRFEHSNVQFVDISPCETYIVTHSKPQSKWLTNAESLKIFHIRTEEMKRAFPLPGDRYVTWPYFKWSFDDKFFASAAPQNAGINVYDASTFLKLNKETIKVDSLCDFSWSPKEHLLAFWVSERGQIPCRVTIMRIPERKEVRSKNLFNVADAQLFWQASGEHLAVKVHRYGKKKLEEGEYKYTGLSHHLEVFCIREKDVPVETMEMKDVVAFAWEPSGNKFCVLHGSTLRSTPTFYCVQKGITVLTSLEPHQGLNSILWAPAGGWLVLAGMKGISGALYFVDASGQEIQKICHKEHPGMSDASWDPTGRYFCTSIGLYGGQRTQDIGYRIWSFQGKELSHQMVEGFCQFHWRPRPPSILPDSKLKEVKRNMKTYAQKFQQEDSRESSRVSKEILERRQKQKADFDAWRQRALDERIKDRAVMAELREEDESAGAEQEEELEEETIELPISRQETVVKSAAE